MQNFREINLPQQLLHRLEQMELITPTPIQAQSLEYSLAGKDILGTAQTGTGKTAAFGIPLVTNLMNNMRGTALVLLPTREIAMQVAQTLRKFIGSSKIPMALLIGGEPMPKQNRQLALKPRLIVGTPGRINDHLTRGSLKLHDTNFLVLDEVDRMLDMGFGVQLDAIARFLTSPKRQTLMFSATLPKEIERVSKKYLTDPVRVSVGTTNATATKIKQENIKLAEGEKYGRLQDEINNRQGSILIFVKTKHGADRMAEKLRKSGHKAEALHGDLRQNKRTSVITGFRKESFRVLVATDVAARGLDIPHIEHVINYDLPQCPEDYIHRVGRTARAGAEGVAVNFLSPSDGIKWKAIQKLLNPNIKASELDDLGGGAAFSKPKKRNYGPKGKGGFKGGGNTGGGGRSGRGKDGKKSFGGGKSDGSKPRSGSNAGGGRPPSRRPSGNKQAT